MASTTAPGPRGKPLVGDILAYESDRVGWLVRNRDRYGDVVRLSPKMVTVHHPELAHRVLAATNDEYTIDALLKSTSREWRALQAYLAEWMQVRREVWKSVSERLTQVHLERFSDRLADDLTTHADRRIDVLATCRRMLGRAIVDFCVGGEPDRSTLDDLYESADALFRTALTALVGGEGRAWWTRRPSARAAVEANRLLLERLAEFVAQRQAGRRPDAPRDLLDALLEPAGEHVVSVLRTVMFASHGVPGTALAWTALALREHPSVTAAVAAEASRQPSAAHGIDALPFTQAVVREVLRLYPPQWLITRTALRDTEIDGHRIPVGTEVLVCPYLLHRDPRWWADPEEFQPSRWQGRDQPHARHAYLPFGAGPRVCPGSHLAMIHLTAATAVLARDYELRLPSRHEVSSTYDGLFAPTELRGGWWVRRAVRTG
jgi:cytochrome P450